MFWIRFRSSVIIMVITILSVVAGGNLLLAATLAISLIGVMELLRIFKVHNTIIGGVGYIGSIAYYFMLLLEWEEHLVLMLIIYLLLIMTVYVLSYPKYNTDQITIVFFSLFYVAIMLSYIYRTRMLEGGAYLVWLIFISAWGSDTCAYLVGSRIGKHKMTPKLSPKKSIEGLFGGIIGAALIGFIFATIFKNQIAGVTHPQLAYTIIGGCGSIISQIGDLAASAIKRNHEIKDYGKLIPGHGGVLDRFDSIIYTAPIVFYLASVL